MDSDSAIGKKVRIDPGVLDAESTVPFSQPFRDSICAAGDPRNQKFVPNYWYMARLGGYDGVVVTHPVLHFSQILPRELVKYFVKEIP